MFLSIGTEGWPLWSSFAAATLMAVAGGLYWRQWRLGAALRTSLDAAHRRLDEAALHDPLTGLPTRHEFELALDDAVVQADRGGGVICLLYVGLDNFRPVNDVYGHGVGDSVLIEAAARIAGAAVARRAASRIGGDEFVLLVDGDLRQGRQAATRLLADLARPFAADVGQEVLIGCSIGIAAYPPHGSRPRLIGNAATAMRSVKLVGGGAHAEYEARMGVDQREQAELARDLRVAVERGQLELFYQPKVDARSLQITAAEALLRWHHPTRGVVSPGVFIPIAESQGLIGSIGNWVVDEATRQASIWRDRGLRMRVAVNVSGYQMRQDDFVERLARALQRNRLAPERFTCEITETVAMEDTLVTRLAFERLGQIGVHVSIDDFGTGHSSLAALRRLPAGELKIDRAFVSDLDTSADALSIAKAIVQMAHSLELRVVAEGVETEAQRDRLVALGCDELQGYLFAKPMSATALGFWAMNDDGREPIGFRPSLFGDTRPATLA